MIYIFIDEKYCYFNDKTRILFACVEFSQRMFNPSKTDLDKLRLTPILQSIKQFVDTKKGHILVAFADVDKSLIPPNKKDDKVLPGVSRNNTFWGAMLTYSIAEMTAILIRRKKIFRTVDVYYDPKSLNLEHQKAIEDVIKNQVRELANDYLAHHSMGRNPKIKYRKIQSVPKAQEKSIETKFQIGTWIADKLTKHYESLLETDTDYISVRDCSNDIDEIFQILESSSNN